jgi:acetyl-CoA acyltransferase
VAEISDVFFVDGMRTPFGRAGEKGMYWNTRSDDLAVKATIGLMERNANVPKDRIDDVAIAGSSRVSPRRSPASPSTGCARAR